MAITVWPVDAVTGAPSYTGRMLREAMSVYMAGASAADPFGVASGVRPGTSTATVTATSTTWTMGLHAGILDMEAAVEAGPYAYAVNTAQTGAVTAANATLPRVDIVWVRLDDPAESDGSSVPAVVAGYTAGTAASTPAAPAAPTRCMVLAQINVPASGGGSPSVTWVAPYAGVTKRSYILSTTTGSLGNLGAVGTISLPAIPVASRVTIAAAGLLGFAGAATTAALNITASAGTMTDEQANTLIECTTAAKWYSYSRSAYLDLPANTASVITVTMSVVGVNSYWKGQVACRVHLPGEY